MEPSVENVVAMIVELSKRRKTDDQVRDIYNVMMDIHLAIIKVMATIRERERDGK